MMQEAEELAESFNKGRTQVVHLAGMGMMVEVLAHELNRTTEQSLATLVDAGSKGLPAEASTWVSTLRTQLATLQKRLRILDPLSTSGRQVKTAFDLIEWVEQIVATHNPQFERHDIECTVTCQPASHSGWPVRMVKGMVVQILENLLINSVYWLKQQKKIDRRFHPRIEVLLQPKARQICITDNGPGVAISRREEIFQPFVTTKPPGEGKGLGLYIAREIATYHDAALFMSDEHTVHKNRLNTFVLALGAGKK
jgi:C4-dicarboxylate-specific signal transduction histidine kinase